MNIDFSKNDYLDIIFVILSIFIILIFIRINNINFNKYTSPPKLIQEITVETMQNANILLDADKLNINPSSGFCESYLENTSQLESACNKLTKTRCLETDCCVYTSSLKCSAGSSNGATYKTDTNGEPIINDYYYYKNKCYGNCK